MAEITQKIFPVKVELDVDEALRSAINCAYNLNVRNTINRNANASADGTTLNQGDAGVLTPTQSLEQICAAIVLPTGNNICTGAFNSPTTQEIYWCNWNDQDNHSIYVYGTETQTCRKVYEGECLGFRFEPEYHIPAHRSALFIVYDSDESGNRVIRNKYYVFTDGINPQRFIDVESSIATDSYNPITFPYFKTFYPHCDPCEFIELGIRPPQNCPKVLAFDDDTDLQFYEVEPENNNLKEKVWWFATSFIDVFGRHSVLSPYSTPVYLDGGDCDANTPDIKCFKLQLDAGSAFVDKIVVYFSNDGITFFQYDIIEKWDNCESPPQSPPADDFWERPLALQNYYEESQSPPCDDTGCFSTFLYSWDLGQSPQIEFTSASIVINGTTYTNDNIISVGTKKFVLWLNGLGLGFFSQTDDLITVSSSATIVYGTITINNSPAEIFEVVISEVEQCSTVNTFIYQFCGNKSCIPIDPAEVARIFDDLPIASVAQAIVDNRVAYGDNKKGYDNFICPIGNIEITTEQDEAPCETELVTIIIDAVIHNPYENMNNIIYKYEGGGDKVAFGGLYPSGNIQWESEIVASYNQEIKNPYKGSEIDGNQGSYGFIGGMRGTNFKAVSQQYHINDLTRTFFFGNVGYNYSTSSIMAEIYVGNYVIQRWVFKIPKGNYIFEIYSHLATSFADCVGTSTYFLGVIPKSLYQPTIDIDSDTDKLTRELLIEACDGDVEYPDYIVISDLTKPKASISVASDARSVAGYLKEKTTNIGIELAELRKEDAGVFTIQSFGTDANGFYFASDGNDFTYNLYVLNPETCLSTQTRSADLDGDKKSLLQMNVIIDNPTLDFFNDCGHELISGTITDCDGNPIQNVNVCLTRTGQVGTTDEDGVYTILAHDNAVLGTTRKNEDADSLIISQQGGCIISLCDECDTCIPITHVTFTYSCFHCISHSPPSTPSDTYNFTLQILSGFSSGIKTGGTYAVAIIGYDYLDRNNQVQRIGFFTVPTIQFNGVFAAYHFNWSLTGLMDFPSWVKKIRFAIRGNNNEFLLSWAANKIEFVDASGDITAPEIAVNIKVYIDGLNTFNTNNFFNTTTSYQWVKGDRIRFITNGDGSVFTTIDNNGLIDLPVSKLVDGNALLIPFDARLTDLTAFATFELYRTPICENEPIYWEQCPTIDVLFNEETQTYEPVITSGTIPFFDTYWFFRAIPMTDQNDIPIIYTAPHPYEHNSPSDFWGAGLFSMGRPFARNPNARQTWHPDEIQWSDSLLQDGNINGLGTWRTVNTKDYGIQFFGGIVGMKAHNHLLFCQCENDFFYVNIAMNLLQITAQGNIIANPDYFGSSNQKIGNNYGVDFRETSTLIFYDDWLSFVDTKRAAVCLSNYQTVEDISRLGMKSYFIEKLRKVATLRDENQFTDGFMFLHSGYDSRTGEIIITSFTRIGSPPSIPYVNEELDYAVDYNETVSFNYFQKQWSGGYVFTPERMICFESGLHGTQLISFRQGAGWIHHKINPATVSYNNIYGTQTKSIITFVMNGGEGASQLQKLFLAIRVECKEQKFYCDQITTQTGQLSKIPPEFFEKISNYFEAPILMDENSEVFTGLAPLLEGTNMFGTWIKIRLIGEAGKEDQYFELRGITISSVESY